MSKFTPHIQLILVITLTFSLHSISQPVYLSDLPLGFIANEFGPPNKDRSFEMNPINIEGELFEKGLGVHAPSSICININGRGNQLMAVIGMDDEIDPAPETVFNKDLLHYSGSEQPRVRFHVTGDGTYLFSSDWFTPHTAPTPVTVDINSVNKVCLIVEPGPSGPEDTHANWAEARISLKEEINTEAFTLYSYPSGILVNHSGYIPASTKLFRMAGISQPGKFSVIGLDDGEEAHSGDLVIKEGDWGIVGIGDFTSLRKPGNYYIKYGNKTSIPFEIHSLNYMNDLEQHFNWFLWQRCGDPYNGWERGQHLDDGIRLDNHEHQDVTGGWHDAADLRKWGMTINGLWSLSEIYLTMMSDEIPEFSGKRDMILQLKDEIAWGNKYFQAMQEPAGYLMNQIGGDVYEHGDNNRFTDNIIRSPDDRWIVTTPNAPVFQFMFIISQCNIALADQLRPENPYVEKAKRCFDWAMENKIVSNIHELGAALTAALKLHKATGEKKYLEAAKDYLVTLLERQNLSHRPMYGFIGSWESGSDPSEKNFPTGNHSYHLITPYFPVWSIVESIRLIEDTDLEKAARQAFNTYVEHFIEFFDKRSSYGIVPMALYPEDPGGNRKAGDYYYRWCYVNREDGQWWNGINPRIGYMGAILVRGGMLTGNSKAIEIGQQ